MRVRLLGPLDVWDGERRLELGAGRHRALLVLLLLHAGEVVSSDRLVDELWDEHAPPSAAKLVQGYVSRLRRVLPPGTIVTRDAGYLITAAETDAAEFERLVAHAAAESPAAAAATLRRALALWSGPALEGLRYERWAQFEILRLEELRLVATEARIDADLQLGHANRLVPELEALAAEHPLREHLQAQLMLALYRAGRQADALEIFAAARRRLVDELGIEPGPELRAMQRRVLAHDPELDAVEPAAVTGATVLRRRSVLAAAVAGALAAAVVLPILALSGSDAKGPQAAEGVAANGVAALDAVTGRVVGSAALEASPGSMASGERSIWVTMPSQDSVSRIDPTSNTVEQTIGVGGGPAGIAVGGGFVWVANSVAGTVSQIDPRTHGGQVVDRIAVGNGPTGIAYGQGGVWVANSIDNTVVRVDPVSGAVGRPISVPAGADTLAVAAGAVWVASESAGVLSRVDARTRSVSAAIEVGNDPVAVAAGAGAIWVANNRDGTVSRVDPAADRVRAVISVGEGPAGIAVTPDRKTVWVANERSGTLSKIDPASDRVVGTETVGAPPHGVALGVGTTYVSFKGSSAAHRGGTLTLAVANPAGVYTPPLPKSLDPAAGYGQWELLTMTNDGLVGYARGGGAAGGRVVPDLALTLPAVSDGGRTYTFQLRTGIRYSTGQLVQPADVRRGIERSLLTSGAAAPSSYLLAIAGARACVTAKRCDLSTGIVVDPHARTVTFHLTAPDPDFLYKLALPTADAVPAGTPLEPHLPLPATGPYEVASYDAKHGVVRLVRNPRFRLWSAAAQPDGFPDRIVERFGYSGPSAVAAVERGAADITADGPDQTWPPAVAKTLRTRYSSRLYHAPATGTVAVWLNTRRPPFDDIRVRRALNYAVDRNHLIDLAGGADLAQVGCQILPPNTDGYRRYCPYTVHADGAGAYNGPDLAKAKRLVTASGTKGQRVTVWFYDIPIGVRNGRYIVSTLRSLGYKARLRTIPHVGETWRADRQAGVGGWTADYPSASVFFSPVFTCASYRPAQPARNANTSEFCSRRIDAEIARARELQTTDPPAASELWSAIDRQLTDEALWVVIRTQVAPDFVSRRAGNYTYCYLGATSGATGACLDQLWVR